MMERFLISWIVENGYPHYKVYDKVTDQTVHCDEGELNKTIWELLVGGVKLWVEHLMMKLKRRELNI